MRLNKQAMELAMADKGLNRIDLANKMGVARQTVYKYLDGSPCKPKAAKKFADALGVPVREILEDEPPAIDSP